MKPLIYPQSSGQSSSTNTATRPEGNPAGALSSMVIPALESSVRLFFNKGIAASTQRAYSSALNRYTAFCSTFNINQPFPLSEQVLCYFAAHLSAQGLKHQSIKSYISGICHAQISLGLPDPFAHPLLPRFEYVMKGIKRSQVEKGVTSCLRLPITPAILCKIFGSWDKAPIADTVMLKAVCCLGFFGFLRTAEFTVPSCNKYDPGIHLSLADIAIDSHSKPTVLQIRIKQSKMDPFRKGVDIFIGRSQADICPVATIVNYLVARGPAHGPLFICANQAPLPLSSCHRTASRNKSTSLLWPQFLHWCSIYRSS